METIIATNCATSFDYSTQLIGTFCIATKSKNSKTLKFLNHSYTAPPKVCVKWENLGNLEIDKGRSSHYRTFDSTPFPFINELNRFFFSKDNAINQDVDVTRRLSFYTTESKKKQISSRLYNNMSTLMQTQLGTIPVYMVLNGAGEIVLPTSKTLSTLPISNGIKAPIEKVSGKFNPYTDKKTQVGLIFMAKEDAKNYLSTIANEDPIGTKTFGLSIHCFGLDFAYRLIQSNNTLIDFRFIPNLTELSNVLINDKLKPQSNLFCVCQSENSTGIWKKLIHSVYYSVPLVPSLFETRPAISYLKGVPIYIVSIDVKNVTTNLMQGLKPLKICLRKISNSLVRAGIYDFTKLYFAFSKNVKPRTICVKNTSFVSNPSSKIFIFFEKDTALNFYRQNFKQIEPYRSNTVYDFLATPPKLLLYNLEDFFELCEEAYANNSTLTIPTLSALDAINLDNIHFISSPESANDILHVVRVPFQKPSIAAMISSIKFKYRRFESFIACALNAN